MMKGSSSRSVTSGTPKLRIARAGEKGFGVFTTKKLLEKVVVVKYKGRSKWVWEIPSEDWPHCFQVDYDRYVLPEKDTPGWYLNHSCEPNCAISGRRNIITMKSVMPGEELTIDYSTNVGWDGFAMECRCGKRKCRGLITSYSSLAPDLKEKYGRYVSAFLLSSTC
jgi:uncharacterized protein